MSYTTDYQKYTLRFKFEAGTSRGVLTTKDTYFISIREAQRSESVGIGEASTLPGLSVDHVPYFEKKLQTTLTAIQAGKTLADLNLQHFPAIRFALEMALQDLQQGGKRQLFENTFSNGMAPIPINGLIWMGPKPMMLQQIKEKLAAGYQCIKLKIGAIDFEEELTLLRYIRTQFGPEEVIVRVDANGAFKPEEALEKLKRLAELTLHSIEQPIATQQWEKMAQLCEQSPLPIALDEELIGVVDRKILLETLKPQYIILKPSLLGGWAASNAWIALAKKHNIGWWMTSALESNIGLNAIAQFTGNLSLHPTATYQGLGTGQLYHNNIPSPLEVKGGWLHYRSHVNWEVGDITKPK